MASVLVVEDDADNRQLLVDVLGRAGFEVHLVGAAGHILQLAREADAVIVDVSPPGESGLDVCRLLRADPAIVWLPVVLLCGHAADQVHACLAAGADSYLVKPFSPAELVAQLRHLVEPTAESTAELAATAYLHAAHRTGAAVETWGGTGSRGGVTGGTHAAEPAERLPPDLLTDLSHELRTPLASIVGYAEILTDDDGAADPAIARMLRVIRRNATRLARVLDNLSALADLDRGDIPRGQDPVNLAALLAQLPTALADEIDQRRVAVQATSSDPLPTVTGDADDLLQAVVELTMHAVDASQAGETVEVVGAVGADEVVVTITGATIAAEPLAGAGRRIGLPVAYGIVAAHGGRVRVATTSTGTRTTVHLPNAG
jgi:signal transduction histidine kinase